ncbi:hypothetical protein BDR03DRAFT_972248 [Suillus americanus]|nr:hypothetical protein BDR03DRAFT_972248 [Suillus americanus]
MPSCRLCHPPDAPKTCSSFQQAPVPITPNALCFFHIWLNFFLLLCFFGSHTLLLPLFSDSERCHTTLNCIISRTVLAPGS